MSVDGLFLSDFFRKAQSGRKLNKMLKNNDRTHCPQVIRNDGEADFATVLIAVWLTDVSFP